MKFRTLALSLLLVGCLAACGEEVNVKAVAVSSNPSPSSGAVATGGSAVVILFAQESGVSVQSVSPGMAQYLGLSAVPSVSVSPAIAISKLHIPADPYFSISTPTAAYYPHLTSLDFDLGLTYLGSPYSAFTCRAEFPILTPSTAFVANPDGFTAQGAPFVRFGLFNANLVNALKTRRVEINTGGANIGISIHIDCSLVLPLPGTPNIARVTPTLGAGQDLITIDGFSFLNPPSTVTIGGVRAVVQNITAQQIVVAVPVNSTTGALVVRKSTAPALLSDQVGTFRVDSIVEETLNDLGGGPTSGLLVTAFYPVGSIDAAGCPTVPEIYSLFTFAYSLGAGPTVHESARVPAGTYDELVWLDPASSGSLKPTAGSRRVQNFSNTVVVTTNQRTPVAHTFSGTYPSTCP